MTLQSYWYAPGVLAGMFIRTLTRGTRSNAMGQIFVLVRYGVRALTQTSGFRDPNSKGDSDRVTMCLTCMRDVKLRMLFYFFTPQAGDTHVSMGITG